MEIAKDIQVNAPIDEVWPFVTDVREVVSCFPGAKITDQVSETEFNAVISVKIGPFSPSFSGTATIEERDDAGHRMVARAKGGDRKLGSSVSALIKISLTEDSPSTTAIHTVTDLHLTGRLAHFGKGIFEGVANRMVGTFVERVNQRFGA